MSNKDVIKDQFFVNNGRKDWKMMLESAKKKAVQAPKGAEKTPSAKVIKSEKDKLNSRQAIKNEIKKEVKELDEDATAAISTTGPGTSTANVAPFASKLGAMPVKRKLNEDDEEQIEGTEDSKVKKIEDKKAKLEQQLADLEEEKLRTIRLSELAKQKEELIKQLEAIKDEMVTVKSGKAIEHDEGSTEEEHEDHEEDETDAEEALEDDENKDEELEFNDDETEDK